MTLHTFTFPAWLLHPSEPGEFPPLVQFVWAYVNMAVALGSAPKQSLRWSWPNCK